MPRWIYTAIILVNLFMLIPPVLIARARANRTRGADDSKPKGIKFLSDGCPSPRDMPAPKTKAYTAWRRSKSGSQIRQLMRKEEQDIVADVKASRGDWQVRTETEAHLDGDAESYRLSTEVRAFEDDEEVFAKRWRRVLPRR